MTLDEALKAPPAEWDAFPWPEWVPEDLRVRIQDFWGSGRRGPAEWLANGRAEYNSRVELGTICTMRTTGQTKRHVTGRYIHCWNNIGRIVDEDGVVHFVSGDPIQVGGVQKLLDAAMHVALLHAAPTPPSYEDGTRALRALEAAACQLDLVGARVLNEQICEHTYWRMGIRDDAPRSLAKADLLEMVCASRIVRALDDAAKNGTIHTVSDDRAVAAIYTTYHYDAEPQRACEPCCMIPGKATIVIEADHTKETL